MWADKLITQYEEGRKELKNINIENISDKEKVNSMISSMTYSIDWLKIGHDPEVFRGVDISQAYHKQFYGNMDLFPAALQPEEREITDEERDAVLIMLMSLTPRERECFVLHHAYMLTQYDIAKELGIGRTSVQKYLERAKKKITCRPNAVQVS